MNTHALIGNGDEPPDHTALVGPFRREEEFSNRLGRLLGEELADAGDQWLAGALKAALLGAATEPVPEHVQELIHQPLRRVEPPVRAAPDIVLADEYNQILLVVETKGPNTRTQWTPLSTARHRRVANSGAAGFIYAHGVHAFDPAFDQPHAYGVPCGCRLLKDLKGDRHCNALHQGDCYVAFDDWIPDGYVLHPEVVRLALLPSPHSVWDWRQHLISVDMWRVARVRTFHDLLVNGERIGYARDRFSDREKELFADLAEQTAVYFSLDTPSDYTDAEWETYGIPEDEEPFVPSQGAVDRFAYAAWQDQPAVREDYRAHLVLTRGRVGVDDGYEKYLASHAQWRANGGSGQDWHGPASAQPATAAAPATAAPAGGRAGEMAKAAGMFLLKATAESVVEARAEKRAYRRSMPSRSQQASDAIAAYIMGPPRQPWQKKADELRELQLKEARKRNGAWW